MLRFAFLAALLAISQAQTPRRLGQYAQSKPYTLSWYMISFHADYRDQWCLIADTLNGVPSTNDNIYRYCAPGRFLNNPSLLQRMQVSNGFNSPKNSYKPQDGAMGEPMIVTHDGHDATNKRRGSVYVIRTGNWTDIRSNQIAGNTLFNPQQQYLSSVWFLGNNDPFADCFTCRNDYTTNPATSELLILLQPLAAPFVRHWDEVSLHNNSCDSFMHRAVYSAQVGPIRRNFDVLFTAGYYSRELMITYTTTTGGLWLDPESIVHRMIGSGKQYYNIISGDLNRDNHPEILVSVKSTNGGGLDIIEVPNDFRTGQYITHSVITGLTGRGAGAGGQIKIFRPITGDTTSKPWIAFAGAENGRAYYLVPRSQDPAVWTYDTFEFPVNMGNNGYCSGIEVGDVDGDGFTEVFISSHAQDVIQVWTFAPAAGK